MGDLQLRQDSSDGGVMPTSCVRSAWRVVALLALVALNRSVSRASRGKVVVCPSEVYPSIGYWLAPLE